MGIKDQTVYECDRCGLKQTVEFEGAVPRGWRIVQLSTLLNFPDVPGYFIKSVVCPECGDRVFNVLASYLGLPTALTEVKAWTV